MRCSGNVIVTVGMKDRQDFAPAEVTSPASDTPESTVLLLQAKDLTFGLYGSPMELLDFASDVMHEVYNWILSNGHSDWLGAAIDPANGRIGSRGNNGRKAG